MRQGKRLATVASMVAVLVAGSVAPAFAWTVGAKSDTIPCTTSCGQQDYNNWCGVASSHAVLHNRGKNIAQSTLASKYGVGRADGSAVAIENIPGVLNGYVSGFSYVHVPRTSVGSASLMASIAQYCTDNGYLGIPCVNPYPYTNSKGQYSPGLPTYSGTARGGPGVRPPRDRRVARGGGGGSRRSSLSGRAPGGTTCEYFWHAP